MPIKHIVISGGGPTTFITYGAARQLSKDNFWKLEDIKTIYGCSAGAYIGVVLSLGYDWDLLDDYFIKRPWDKVLGITPSTIFESFVKKGVIGERFMRDSIGPLFTAKDIDVNITMREYYDLNGIDIHMYSANINSDTIEKVDISHTTHPDITVIKALQMSTSLPFAFEPVVENNACYIDGGIINNFPLNDCIEQTKCDTDEIMAFKNIWLNVNATVTDESSLMDFLNTMIWKIQCYMGTEDKQSIVKNTVECIVEDITGIVSWINIISTMENRKRLIDSGVRSAIEFLNKLSELDRSINEL